MDTPDMPADGEPFTTVVGQNDSWYPCPDTASVDRHIVELTRRIGHAEHRYPQLAEAYRADIDLLLDRRNWLAVIERRAEERRAAERRTTVRRGTAQPIPEPSTPERPVIEAV